MDSGGDMGDKDFGHSRVDSAHGNDGRNEIIAHFLDLIKGEQLVPILNCI